MLKQIQRAIGSGRLWRPSQIQRYLPHTFVLPVTFATTLPPQALNGSIGWLPVLNGFALSTIAVFSLRALWRVGVRTYASASG